MTVADKQRKLIDDFTLIENRQERLAAIVDRARRLPPLPSADRSEVHRVPGCVSSVWLHATVQDGRMHFRHDADSPLVRGLVALLCELYEGGTPEEVASFESSLLDELGLVRDLSPTRRNGLAAVRARIKSLASGQLRGG